MAKKEAKGGKAPKKGAGGAAPGKASVFKAKPKKKKSGPPTEPPPPPRLKAHYADVVVPALREKFGYKSALATPRITKVIVSMGVGDAHENAKKLEALIDELETITGQRPLVTRARLSVANFRLRQGMANGLKVTMRRTRMWEFLDRLISVVIPRMRDFRGLTAKSFDGRGNYAVGLPDQLVFPEIKVDKVDYQHGMNIAVVTTAQTDEEARELLRLTGFPFRDLPVQVLGSQES